jgi:hypothetical protein
MDLQEQRFRSWFARPMQLPMCPCMLIPQAFHFDE